MTWVSRLSSLIMRIINYEINKICSNYEQLKDISLLR